MLFSYVEKQWDITGHLDHDAGGHREQDRLAIEDATLADDAENDVAENINSLDLVGRFGSGGKKADAEKAEITCAKAKHN